MTTWFPSLSDISLPNVTTAPLAMKLATVFRCTDILSKGIAQLPIRVCRDAGGYFVYDADNPLNYLLGFRPNERQNAFDFVRNIVIQAVNRGNAYVIPSLSAEGWERFVLCSPGAVTYDSMANVYLVSDAINGIFGTFVADEVIHIRNISLDGGYTGVSTIQYASRVLSIADAADDTTLKTFASGGVNKGFVSGKGATTLGFGDAQDNQLSDVATRISRELSSGKNVFHLPGEMTFNTLNLSPADIELLASKNFNVIEICRFYGVHPDKVFAQQSTNYKASEMSQIAFMTDTLQPLLRQIAIELQTKLIPRKYNAQYRIEFDLEKLYQTDLVTEATYIEKTVATGVRTVNEWRKIKGQPPVAGGDRVLVSCNLSAIDSPKIIGDNPEAVQNG